MIDQQEQKQLNHTKKLGNLAFINYLKSQPETLNLIFSVEKYLEEHPPFYLASISIYLKGRPIDFVKDYLQKQYSKLLNKTSFYHSMNSSLQARLNCINKIKRDLTKAIKFLNLFKKQYHGDSVQDQSYLEWVQIEGYSTIEVDETIQNSIKMLSNIFVDLYRLRDMTIYIVQTIYAWKIALQEHSDRCHQYSPVHYYYQEKQVYEMIIEDTDFIWKSKLSDYIYMQAKQDPFLIRNVIYVEQRQPKTVLERYFLQIMYPREELIVDKSIRCFEMLLFKYKPKISNLFQEEELLIQNYLKMELINNEFNEQRLGQTRFSEGFDSKNQTINMQKTSPQIKNKKKNLLNARGWVFEHTMKGKAKERINKIVQSHNQKIKYIAPFNIVNYNQKSSMALAYLNEVRHNQDNNNSIKNRIQSTYSSNSRTPKRKQQHQVMSEGQEYRSELKQNIKKNFQSQPQNNHGKESRMFKSLAKIHHIIIEDPKQQIPDTPKNKLKLPQPKIPDNIEHSINQVKLNSFAFAQNDGLEQKIKIEEQETPLNIKQFYEIFRADTTTKAKGLKDASSTVKKQNQAEKITTFKQFLQKSRMQRAKSLITLRKPKISFPSKKKEQERKLKQSRSKDKSTDSYPEFEKIKHESISNVKLNEIVNKSNLNQFIHLKAKSIPYDIVLPYIKHLYSQVPQTSKIFMNFSLNEIVKKLGDPYIHCIMFELSSESHKKIGQIILSQSVGGRAGRLKYTIEFINIHLFELIISSILRISEELLFTTPCEQVICPLIIDKMDLISSHFVELIGVGLAQKVNKFGRLAILQKIIRNNNKEDLRERLYIITSENRLKKQYELGLKMMGNYRSLKFQTKCLVLTSNFRLRSKTLIKNALNKYKKVALGELFSKLFRKVMTKYHLKHLKTASYSSNQSSQFVNIIKNDLFLRNIIQSFIISLKNENQSSQSGSQLIYLTPFSTMGDLLNYIHYKRHDSFFQFQFLQDSKFILNHELHLAQLDQEVSLEFTMTSNEQLYILYNHRNVRLTMLRSTKMNTEAYLIPTSNQKIHLFLMSANQYLETATDQLDMYSYLSFYLKNLHSQIYLNQVASIILPNLKHHNTRVNKVRMYDGFFKIFPERQFYSAAMIRCLNFWESYYPNAVVHIPKENSIIFEYPFLVGFYDVKTKTLLNAFLFGDASENSP